MALAVDEGDGALGADFLAGGGQAVLAALGDPVLVCRAGVAGVGDDIDERRFVVLLGNGGMVHAVGHQGTGLHGADAQAHCQAHALTGDGALQEHRFPVQGLVTGDDDVGQILGVGIITAGVSHPGDLGKDFFTNVRNQGRNTSH